MATSALPPPTLDPLGAPTPRPESSSTPLLGWLALAAVAGVVTFFVVRQPRETSPHSLSPVVVASRQPAELNPEPEAEAELADVLPEDPAELYGLSEPEEGSSDDSGEEPVEAPNERDAPAEATPMTSMVGTGSMAARTPAPITTTAAPTRATMRATTPAMTATRAMSDDRLPQTPTRAEVQSALLAVRGRVGECMTRGGRVPVRVTVSGRTGRVTTAQVEDAYFARQPTGGCIAQAVRRARFPLFQQERLVIVYPYEF